MPAELLTFLGVAVVMIVTPGPDTALTIRNTIAGGRAAGLGTAVGVCSGQAIWTLAAAAGVAALLVASEPAFLALKYAGAAYLVGLGVWTLVRRREEPAAAVPRERKLSRRFWQGVVVNVLNPKTALFFFAFLPQFVDPGRGSAALQIGVLGLVFVLLAVASDSIWALAAGTASERLRGNPRFLAVQRYVSGSVFVGLGALTAAAKRH